MSVAVCDGCGKYEHVCLEVLSDGAVNTLVGEKLYCGSCGLAVAATIKEITEALKNHYHANT